MMLPLSESGSDSDLVATVASSPIAAVRPCRIHSHESQSLAGSDRDGCTVLPRRPGRDSEPVVTVKRIDSERNRWTNSFPLHQKKKSLTAEKGTYQSRSSSSSLLRYFTQVGMEQQTMQPSDPSTQAHAELAYLPVLSASMPESGSQEPMQIQIAGGDERIELSVLRSAPGVSPALLTALSKYVSAILFAREIFSNIFNNRTQAGPRWGWVLDDERNSSTSRLSERRNHHSGCIG